MNFHKSVSNWQTVTNNLSEPLQSTLNTVSNRNIRFKPCNDLFGIFIIVYHIAVNAGSNHGMVMKFGQEYIGLIVLCNKYTWK